MSHKRYAAMVLLGPTGSGKTPLGHVLAARGLLNSRCVHFDFGENLRDIVARGEPDDGISRDDLDFLRRVLDTGALLEDRDSPIALRILQSFLARRRVEAATTLVLNGLPRHVGQAIALAQLLDMHTAVLLSCPLDVVLKRIANNAGGDREQRADDDRALIERKLELFRQRTAPLVDHFRDTGARVIRLEVTADMTANDMWMSLSDRIGTR
ncbi:MAG: hypothetical protein FJ276_16160 [Planctomycetes bacterium]|nr:hypothetical protein [Planctomycetota bacterium]